MKRIDKFSIISIKMEGFKKFNESKTIRLDSITRVIGGNGEGKSTIADAIAYAFCGTPFWGEQSLDKLQNPAASSMQVEVQFVDGDGEVHTLIRQRKNGTTTAALDGTVMKQSDMAATFAEKDILLSILNPQYFIEKLAEGGKVLLQKLIPPVTKEAVLEKFSESTRTLLEKVNFSDPAYFMKQKREELKEISESETYTQGQIDVWKKQQEDASERLTEVLKRGDELSERKNALEDKSGIDMEAFQNAQEAAMPKQNIDRQAAILAKRAEIQARQYVSQFTEEIVKTKTEMRTLVAKHKQISARIEAIKVGDVCPTCQTIVTEESYKSIVAGLHQELATIVATGKGLKTRCDELEELDKKSQAKFEEFKTADIQKADAYIAEMEKATSAKVTGSAGKLTPEEFAEFCELQKKIKEVTDEVNSLCEADKTTAEIEKAEKKLKALALEKQETTALIRAVGEFAAKRAEIILSTLKMPHAAFKLQDVVKSTGEVKDVFDFTYDGKDYQWLSASERLKAGIEVATLLQNLTGLKYPTYIDNAECITTKFTPTAGQVILAYARNCELTIQGMSRKPQQQEAA